MFDLMVVERTFLLGQGNARTIRVISIPAYRGIIVDRNGKPLAISAPVDSIWANPQKFELKENYIAKLSNTLHIPDRYISRVISQNKSKEFIYLKRQVDPSIGKDIQEMKIPGVHIDHEFKRYYPAGQSAAQLVGFTNIDDQGQEGLELEYNKWLQGIPGRKRVLVDRFGRVVEDLNILKKPKPGHNLVLSIDRRIQYIAFRDLKNAIKKYKAKSGSIVVLDAKNSEVLAMANYPSFNPNKRPTKVTAAFRNRAVTDLFEPGSTFKAFAVANALRSGKYTPDTIVNTAPGWMMIGRNEVKDDTDNGIITVTQILQRSSNIGATKLTLSLPPNSLWELLHSFGFGVRTDSGFPGESSGELLDRQPWRPFELATMSFGYGVAVTTLQLAHAYNIFAAGGIRRPVSLLKLNEMPKGKRIISAKISHEILNMLETVVEAGGTATRAQVPGYRVTGKTGTVRIVGPNGYEKNHHNAMFVGVAPASEPRFVIAVYIHDPRGGQFYGGLVAAPVFSQVMGSTLRIYDVTPDKLKRHS